MEMYKKYIIINALMFTIFGILLFIFFLPLIKKLIEAQPMDVCPKLVIKNDTKDFYEFKVEDFEIIKLNMYAETAIEGKDPHYQSHHRSRK